MRNATVIVPTYRNEMYIDECLESILAALGPEGEVLVGIDACQQTLDHISKSSHDERIRFFMFKENSGPYVIKNSLAPLARHEFLVFFDSDDIMKEGMVEQMKAIARDSGGIARSMYEDFADGEDWRSISSEKTGKFADGVFAIEKDKFLSMNGFEPWRVGADSEFKRRAYKNRMPEAKAKETCFLRRRHASSLTGCEQTGFGSKIRAEYGDMIWKKRDFGPLPKLHVAEFEEVSRGV